MTSAETKSHGIFSFKYEKTQPDPVFEYPRSIADSNVPLIIDNGNFCMHLSCKFEKIGFIVIGKFRNILPYDFPTYVTLRGSHSPDRIPIKNFYPSFLSEGLHLYNHKCYDKSHESVVLSMNRTNSLKNYAPPRFDNPFTPVYLYNRCDSVLAYDKG